MKEFQNAVGFRVMTDRPRAGMKLTVLLRDGSQLSNCHATHVVSDRIDAIVIYHKRNAIDESQAKGWWPL